MKPAQQLVALTMLGMEADQFLEATPYGFEVLSTHIAKSAIAASSVIKEESHPTLQEALQSIGFEIDDSSTSDELKTEWGKLATLVVVEHAFDYTGTETERSVPFENAMKTRPMNVELRQLWDIDTDEPLLQIDSMAFKTLTVMDAQAKDKTFVLPSTWIHFGASPFADGFVTFSCKKKTPETATANPPFKFTLENQAKDYHNGSKLLIRKLNEHAVRCGDSLLDGVFG